MDAYKQSGVDLKEAERLNKILSRKIKDKNISEFVGSVDYNGIKIYNCCDGIGTKIIPLYKRKRYADIAQEVVAANLNDMATRDVMALGFSDYIAVNKLDSDAISSIIIELKKVLEQCNCRLLGGETSEMSDILRDGVIDIAGFAIGAGGGELQKIETGDILIGLKSSGVHANGFSLVRKLYNDCQLSDKEFETCLVPTYIYYNTIRKLWNANLIKAGANITGGGLIENLSRIVEVSRLELFKQNIPQQPIFQCLHELVGDEIYNVFNCGVGFCIFAAPQNKEKIFEICKEFTPFELGRIII